jgi:hypothetical protein
MESTRKFTNKQTRHLLESSSGCWPTEKPIMTMRVVDIAPNEALAAKIADQLENASSSTDPSQGEPSLLDLDPVFLDTAKEMLAQLTQRVPPAKSARMEETPPLLDLEPQFLDKAAALLREFIARTENRR